MAKPDQGGLELLADPVAQRLLASLQVAHLAYTWTDGTPRCTPIWFHWDGSDITMGSPAIAPKSTALEDGAPVAVTIDDHAWPYTALLVRGHVRVETLDEIPREYRLAAARYLGGEEQGDAWCDQLPPARWNRFRVTPEWVGVLDLDGLRRLPSAVATLMSGGDGVSGG